MTMTVMMKVRCMNLVLNSHKISKSCTIGSKIGRYLICASSHWKFLMFYGGGGADDNDGGGAGDNDVGVDDLKSLD